MTFDSLNLYTEKGDLLMIPTDNLVRNPMCKLAQNRGQVHILCFDVKPGTTYKCRSAKGTVTERSSFRHLNNIVGIEFETRQCRAYFSIKNSKCRFRATEDAGKSIIIKGDK